MHTKKKKNKNCLHRRAPRINIINELSNSCHSICVNGKKKCSIKHEWSALSVLSSSEQTRFFVIYECVAYKQLWLASDTSKPIAPSTSTKWWAHTFFVLRAKNRTENTHLSGISDVSGFGWHLKHNPCACLFLDTPVASVHVWPRSMCRLHWINARALQRSQRDR